MMFNIDFRGSDVLLEICLMLEYVFGPFHFRLGNGVTHVIWIGVSPEIVWYSGPEVGRLPTKTPSFTFNR